MIVKSSRNQLNKRHIAEAFGQAAHTYNASALLQRKVSAHLREVLREDVIALVPIKSLLDIGCGTGAETVLLAPFAESITALDLSQNMLRFAQQQDQNNVIANFVCADAERLPFIDNQFDVIYSSFVLQWCHDLPAVLNSLYRLLRPGGKLVFALPVHQTLWELKISWQNADAGFDHVNAFPSGKRIRQAIRSAGFKIARWETHKDIMHYETVNALMVELKSLGAHQVTGQRRSALMGKQAFLTMKTYYEQFRLPNGLLPASWHWLSVKAVKPLE